MEEKQNDLQLDKLISIDESKGIIRNAVKEACNLKEATVFK